MCQGSPIDSKWLKPMTIAPLASFWLAAAESGYAAADDWRSWADRQILALDAASIPIWILDLSIAKSAAELRKVLSPTIELEVDRGFHRDLIHEAVLGYFWLRLVRGDIDLKTCLILAGRHADSYEAYVECEAIFSLLTRTEKNEAMEAGVMTDSRKLFQPLSRIAEEQWSTLQQAALP